MRKARNRLVLLSLFAMYGGLMYVSKLIMEGLPNIHPLTMFIMTFTVVYGIKALIPTYVYVFINGLYAGFNIWWMPYLYLWAIQCLITLAIPKRIPDKIAAVVYPVLCALLGLTFGVMYAPAQALMFKFSFEQTITWIMSGLAFDVLHMGGNFVMGLLVLPLSKLIKRMHSSTRIPV
jgi:energy-coupling factor transport system substrate-specific component